MQLEGRRALVTGGASGIGLAVAKRFAAEGAKVVIADLNDEDAAAAVSESGGKFGKTIGDVSKLVDAERMVNEAAAQMGGLDILINNAGIETMGSVTTARDDEWERQINVNLNGVYRVSRFAVPRMIEAGGGSIVNMSSVGGLVAVKEFSAYGASKAAVIQLTRSMAADYADNKIRVNAVCPGAADTPLLQRSCSRLGGDDPQKMRDLFASFTLLKRIAKAEEIASAILFLASDESSFITGVALPVDGGFSAQ
jgi:NAD(P)-dependent dehydrogenase (short-subunit alcohol dehydrogenase family)